MPEINIRVKIIGGKRTNTSISVESMAINSRKLSFVNGATIPDTEFEGMVRKAIIEYIIDKQKQISIF